ncbi:MAG: lipoprotein [Alcaligenaceae bacterium]|nr:lipoprotein [Alcaligenaceae bacterium]
MLIKLFNQTKNDLEVGVATQKKLLSAVIAAFLLSACGQKTPVYLPSAAQQRALDERDARIKARKEARKNETAEQKAARQARIEYGRQRAQEFRDAQELSNSDGKLD